MKHRIAFFTSTRGDMTILEPLIDEVKKNRDFNYLFFVHGTHLKKEYGYTIKDIRKKFKISEKFSSVSKVDNTYGIMESIKMTQINVNRIFNEYKFDSVVILGDRIERLPIITAAIAYRKYIFHLHGGEITTGVLDDQVRHMITKSSHLHFTICEEYKKNILKMSEEKFRVYNVGSLGIEKIKLEFNKKLSLKDTNSVIVTYHPETLKKNFNWKKNFLNILNALNKYNFNVTITSPGHEKGTQKQIEFIKKFIKKKKNFEFIESLGINGYFKKAKESLFVIGNSSSGIIEIPYFKIPTINIGLRQNGRFFHESIIQCDANYSSIIKSIEKAKSNKFRNDIQSMKLHFGTGGSAKKILSIIKKNLKNKEKLLNKKFYNK